MMYAASRMAPRGSIQKSSLSPNIAEMSPMVLVATSFL